MGNRRNMRNEYEKFRRWEMAIQEIPDEFESFFFLLCFFHDA